MLGWMMKRAQWPRAPLLVGFVLAEPIERNFWLAYQLHGWSWLQKPIVIGLILVVVVHIALTFRRALAARRVATAAGEAPAHAEGGLRPDIGLLLAAAAAAMFAGAIWLSFDLAFDSRLVPLLAAMPGLLAALALVAGRLRGDVPAVAWPPQREAQQLVLLGAGIAAIPLAGFLPALGGYLVAMLWTCSTLRFLIVPYVAAILAAAYGLSRAFNIPVP
jgi:hypothetical protein